MASRGLETAQSDMLLGWKIPVILGFFGAALGTALVVSPWISIILCTMVIMLLSATENRTFLLLVVLLTPVGWLIGKTDALVSAFPSRSNIDAALLVRCVVIVGFFLGRFWRGKLEISRMFRPTLSRSSLAFAASVFASAVLSEPELRLASTMRVALRLATYLGFFFFTLTWCDSQEKVERVVRVLMISTFAAAVFGIVQVAVGGYTPLWHLLYPADSDTFPWDSRATSFLDYPNDLAGYLNLILPLALACYATGRRMWGSLGARTFLLGTIALVCTQSRGGMLGFVCMLVAGIFFLVEKFRTKVLAMAALAVLGTIVYMAVIDSETMHLGINDLSTGATRLLLWDAAWNLFLGSPIHGIGWGNFQVLSSSYLDSSLVAESQLGVHNIYLSLLAETGVLGFLAFVTLLYLSFREAHRHFRTSPNPLGRVLGFGVMGAIVAMLGQGFVEFQIPVTEFDVLFWMLLALLVVSVSLTRQVCCERIETSGAAPGENMQGLPVGQPQDGSAGEPRYLK
jgi:putative inorganic carbon (hco3(-)) transporter